MALLFALVDQRPWGVHTKQIHLEAARSKRNRLFVGPNGGEEAGSVPSAAPIAAASISCWARLILPLHFPRNRTALPQSAISFHSLQFWDNLQL